jgi:hypothetical protein
MIREIEFGDRMAYHLWIHENGPHITVIDQSDLAASNYLWSYEASARLKLPPIVVKYIDFRED